MSRLTPQEPDPERHEAQEPNPEADEPQEERLSVLGFPPLAIGTILRPLDSDDDLLEEMLDRGARAVRAVAPVALQAAKLKIALKEAIQKD